MNFAHKKLNLRKQIMYDLNKYNSEWIKEISEDLYNIVSYYQITSKKCNTLKQLRCLIEDAIHEIKLKYSKDKLFTKINIFNDQLKHIIKLDMELIYSEDEILLIEDALREQTVYIQDNLYNSMIL